MAGTEAPTMSVIVATYNAAAFIDRTLASIRDQDQSSDDVEVVVVDGASTDDTVERIRRSGLTVVLRSAPDGGIYDAMNIGVSMATGTWVQFLNAGDTFHAPDSLEEVLGALRAEGEEHQWLITGAQNMQGGAGPARVIRNLPYRRYAHLFGLQPHCHQACWFRRDAFDQLGGHRLDMGIVADYDLIARFGSAGAPVELRSIIIDYLGGGVSEVSAREIATRLHEARVRRFDFGAHRSAADLLIARGLGAFNGLRVLAGKPRRALRG